MLISLSTLSEPTFYNHSLITSFWHWLILCTLTLATIDSAQQLSTWKKLLRMGQCQGQDEIPSRNGIPSLNNSWVHPRIALNGDIIFQFDPSGRVSATFEYDNKKQLKMRAEGSMGIQSYPGHILAHFHYNDVKELSRFLKDQYFSLDCAGQGKITRITLVDAEIKP